MGSLSAVFDPVEDRRTQPEPRSSVSEIDDGWTEHATDNRPSAQFEHTVLVTDTGAEILTVTTAGNSAAGTPDTISDRHN